MPTLFKKNPQTAGRIVEGQAFVVTPDDNKLHTLNSTGTYLWELAFEGVTVDAAAEAIVERFDVDLETARKDVSECLERFVEQQILVRSE